MTHGLFLPPMSAPGSGAGGATEEGVTSAEAGVEWSDDLEAALMLAGIEQKPVMIDFTADWCIACKELDHLTFSEGGEYGKDDCRDCDSIPEAPEVTREECKGPEDES